MSQKNPLKKFSPLKIQREILQRSFLTAFFVFCVMFGGALWGWRISLKTLQAKQQSALENLSYEMTNAMQTEIFAHMELLNSVQRFFKINKTVEREEWQAFLESYNLKGRHPDLVAVRYIERVKNENKEAFIQSVRSDRSVSPGGYPDFDIHPMPGTPGPSSVWNESYVIKYVAPFLGNEKMMGGDLFSDASRRKIYEDAWMTGEAAGKISEEIQTGNGAFVVCAPIYSNSLPHSGILEKQKAFTGFVDTIVLTDEFFTDILKKAKLFSQVFFEVYGGDLANRDPLRRNLIFSNYQQKNENGRESLGYQKASFKTRHTLKIADRIWTVFFFSTSNFHVKEIGDTTPLIVLIGGSCLSLLVWGILYVLSTSRLRAVLLAQEITKELRESEERLRAISQSAIDAIISADHEKKIVFWNRGAEKIFGFEPFEILGKALATVTPHWFLSNAEERSSGKPWEGPQTSLDGKTIEVSGVRKDGSEFPAEISVATWKKGEEDFWTVIVRDISERKKVEKIQNIEHAVMKILASAQKMEQGISEIVQFLCKEFNWELGVFWFVDEDEALLRCVSSFSSRFEECASWIRNQTFAKGVGFAGQALEKRQFVWMQDVASDAMFQGAMPLPPALKNGMAFPVFNHSEVIGVLAFLGASILKLVPIPINFNEVEIGAIPTTLHEKKIKVEIDKDFLNLFDVILQQIGQFVWQKLMEVEFKKAERSLGERERSTVVSQLAAGVAHEVKNPLAIILQGVDFLKNSGGMQDPTALGVLRSVTDAVQRADTIIRGLLELSRPEPLKLRLEDVNAVLETSLLLVKNSMDRNNIHVQKQWQSGLPKVAIDRGKIEQVFINLFMNAVDAMEPGGRLILRTQWAGRETAAAGSQSSAQTQDRVIVEIEDTGCGIPEQVLSKVFSPFVTSKRARGGSGLGLPIVRNIMEMHKGTVQIENVKSGGIRVTVVFPCHKRKIPGGSQ